MPGSTPVYGNLQLILHELPRFTCWHKDLGSIELTLHRPPKRSAGRDLQVVISRHTGQSSTISDLSIYLQSFKFLVARCCQLPTKLAPTCPDHPVRVVPLLSFLMHGALAYGFASWTYWPTLISVVQSLESREFPWKQEWERKSCKTVALWWFIM